MKTKGLLLLLLFAVFSSSIQMKADRKSERNRLESYKARHPKKFEQNVHYRPSMIEYAKDEQSFGITYNYGQHFPLGLSLNYGYGLLMLSLDYGQNFDKDKFISFDEGTENASNYKKVTLDPQNYITLTPQFYLKYFSVGCGVGCMLLNKEVETKTTISSSSESSSTSQSTTSSLTDTSYKLMIRPTVKGFIPINDNFSIMVSAGYDYCFDFKEKNGFNAGLGLQWIFDY